MQVKEAKKQDVITAKKGLNQKWRTILYNVIINKSDPIVFLQETAKSLGLNINFLATDIEISKDFFYKSNQKSFIDIILDIILQLNLKITINDLNASITTDSVYFCAYPLKDLPGSQSVGSSTGVQNNFDSAEHISTQSEYSNKIDYYSEIDKNLKDLFQGVEDSKYSINKQGGVLIVIATQKMHRQISSYLASLSKNMNDEILVEANIMEVTLDKGYDMGVGWKQIINSCSDLNYIGIGSGQSTLLTMNNGSEFLLNLLNANYKKVKSISNPRLLLANNHSGVFKAVENYPYFDYRIDTIDGGRHHTPTQSKRADLKNAVVGVTLYVHVLKLDEDRVKIYFKPSVTEISQLVDHAGYKYLTNSSSSEDCPKIPILRTREMDSTITLENGQSVIIGGLIVEKVVKESEDPISSLLSMVTLGLLSSKAKTVRSELVIILTVNGANNNIDYDYYHIFTSK